MKKSIKALLALLALAATAAPAMAFENEIHGSFLGYGTVSNYKFLGNDGLSDSAATANWFEQRARFAYAAKADENVKLVAKFELDYAFWGNSSYATGRNEGGALGADSVQIETKNLYLDWTAPSINLNTKIGMMGYDDAFSGIFFSNDMAGILASHSYTNATASAGFFRWMDGAGTGFLGEGDPTADLAGRKTTDVFVLDGKYNVSKDVKVGAAYYYFQDKAIADDAKVHTLGVNGEAALGGMTVNGFVVGQFGELSDDVDAKGYAAKIAARTAVGTGTLRADLLYAAGGKNQLYVAPDGAGYYDNEMVILSRDKYACTIDYALVNDVNNGGEGVIFGSLGFDQPFSPTLSASFNLGLASVAKDLNNTDSKYIGTELNVELDKKVTDNLTVIGRAAYVVLGDHMEEDADDPYSAQVLVAYKF